MDGSAFEPLWGPQDLPSEKELEAELGADVGGQSTTEVGSDGTSAGMVSEELRRRVLAWSLRRCWAIADRRTAGLMLAAAPEADRAPEQSVATPQQVQPEKPVGTATVRA